MKNYQVKTYLILKMRKETKNVLYKLHVLCYYMFGCIIFSVYSLQFMFCQTAGAFVMYGGRRQTVSIFVANGRIVCHTLLMAAGRPCLNFHGKLYHF
ncbi:MAG: hypothetical protein NC347_08070 [Clostridium sp.]|nr:hypothetical protein [Clostridium sp.]